MGTAGGLWSVRRAEDGCFMEPRLGAARPARSITTLFMPALARISTGSRQKQVNEGIGNKFI